jgi:hypothetical protein
MNTLRRNHVRVFYFDESGHQKVNPPPDHGGRWLEHFHLVCSMRFAFEHSLQIMKAQCQDDRNTLGQAEKYGVLSRSQPGRDTAGPNDFAGGALYE